MQGGNCSHSTSQVSDFLGLGFYQLTETGYNTTLTLKTHNGTVPTQPRLGHALSSISIEIPTPKLTPPKNPNHPDDEDDDRDENAPHFIDDATVGPASLPSLPMPILNPLTTLLVPYNNLNCNIHPPLTPSTLHTLRHLHQCHCPVQPYPGCRCHHLRSPIRGSARR